METLSLREIQDFFEKSVDTTGWISKTLSHEGSHAVRVRVEYKHESPRSWMIVSNNGFSSLGSITIVEIASHRRIISWN